MPKLKHPPSTRKSRRTAEVERRHQWHTLSTEDTGETAGRTPDLWRARALCCVGMCLIGAAALLIRDSSGPLTRLIMSVPIAPLSSKLSPVAVPASQLAPSTLPRSNIPATPSSPCPLSPPPLVPPPLRPPPTAPPPSVPPPALQPAPPPVAPPSPTPPTAVEVINARFRAGRPSSDLSEAGVIIHIFDEQHQQREPWEPGYHSSSHLSCSVIHAGLRDRGDRPGVPLPFSDGGLVIRPSETSISCAYAVDAASMSEHSKEGLSGCPNLWCAPPFEGKGCGFRRHRPKSAWHGEDLKHMLALHMEFGDAWHPPGFHSGYNEVIIQANVWKSHLPSVVEAVFRVKDCECQHVRDVAAAHANFLQRWGLSAAQVPLLELDPFNWDEPFTLADVSTWLPIPAKPDWSNPDWG